MRSPDEMDFCSAGVFKEVVPMDRLVLIDSFADSMGTSFPLPTTVCPESGPWRQW